MRLVCPFSAPSARSPLPETRSRGRGLHGESTRADVYPEVDGPPLVLPGWSATSPCPTADESDVVKENTLRSGHGERRSHSTLPRGSERQLSLPGGRRCASLRLFETVSFRRTRGNRRACWRLSFAVPQGVYRVEMPCSGSEVFHQGTGESH